MRVEVTKTFRRIVKLKVEQNVLKVVAYAFLSDKKLKQIISENINWINSQKSQPALRQADEVQAPQCKPVQSKTPAEPTKSLLSDIRNGYKTVLSGSLFTVRPNVGSKSFLDGDVLFISEKYFETKELRLKAIKNFLKKCAIETVSNEIADFGSYVSLCPEKIEFRNNDDFWVKCSLAGKRILCFDFRVVQLPPKLRKYVIAHGFAHFAHPLHDNAFWTFLSDALPSYRECARELEKYRVLKDI